MVARCQSPSCFSPGAAKCHQRLELGKHLDSVFVIKSFLDHVFDYGEGRGEGQVLQL